MDRWAAKEVAQEAGDPIPETAEERIRQFREMQAARRAVEPIIPMTWGAEKKIGIHMGDTEVRVAVIDAGLTSNVLACELVCTFAYSALGWQLATRGQASAPSPRLGHLVRMLSGMQSGASALLADMYADILRHSRKQLEAKYGKTSAKLTAVVSSTVASEMHDAAIWTADCICAAGVSSSLTVSHWLCESEATVRALGLAPRREAESECLALVFHARQPVRAVGDVQTLQVSILHMDQSAVNVRASSAQSVEQQPQSVDVAAQLDFTVGALEKLVSKVLTDAALSLDSVAELVLVGWDTVRGTAETSEPCAWKSPEGNATAVTISGAVDGVTSAIGTTSMECASAVWNAQLQQRLVQLYGRPFSGALAPSTESAVPACDALVAFGAAMGALHVQHAAEA